MIINKFKFTKFLGVDIINVINEHIVLWLEFFIVETNLNIIIDINIKNIFPKIIWKTKFPAFPQISIPYVWQCPPNIPKWHKQFKLEVENLPKSLQK